MPEDEQASGAHLRRHDLLRVAPDVWTSVLAHDPPSADLPLVGSWADRGWPVIVRRRAEAEDPALVPIGLPLPPTAGKRRLAFLLPLHGIRLRSSPPLLREAASAAYPGWKSTIVSLLALGDHIRAEPSAFGSLMWQHQTGLPYLSPRSDLDVLWRVSAGFDARSLVSGIAEIQRDAPLRIDGEVIFPDGSAVHWRELWTAYQAEDHPEVLAKTNQGVRLLDVAILAGVGQHA